MTIDRDRLSKALEANTPLTLRDFDKIHNVITDRQEAFVAYSYWAALKACFPEASLWRVKDLTEETRK
jgi:hypothetical protein